MKKIILLLIISLFYLNAFTKELKLNNWIYLKGLKLTKYEIKNSINPLDFNFIYKKGIKPKVGDIIHWNFNQIAKWKKYNGEQLTKDSINYFFTTIDSYKFQKSKIYFNSNKIRVFYNDKEERVLKDKQGNYIEVYLKNAKNYLLIKLIPENNQNFEAKLKFDSNSKIINTYNLKRRVSEEDILNTININNIKISTKNSYLMLSLSKTDFKGKTNRWYEIYKINSRKLVFNSKNIINFRAFKWFNDYKFLFTKTKNGKTSIYLYNLINKTQKLILKDLSNFMSFEISKDNKFLIYSVYKRKPENKIFKYFDDLTDKMYNSGYSYSFYIHFLNSGATHKISTFKDMFYYAKISPDSKKILFIKIQEDYSKRPFSKNTFYILDIRTFKLLKLFESRWANDAIWSPDSTKLLVLGGPSSFNGIGKNLTLKKEIIPNEYDIQAYIFDINSKKVSPISKKFSPSIKKVFWNKSNTIILTADYRDYVKAYKYNIKNKRYIELKTGVDVVRGIDVSFNSKFAFYSGTSSNIPYKLYKLNINSSNFSLFKDFNKEEFKRVKFGKVKNWNFKASTGNIIDGRIYFPPDFNNHKKYPCIVYYYGGTSPVTRDFGGRYPKNWYASKGYIVYVLQPTGTVGYGQDKSSVHVNDWGETTSKEIIESVKKLIKEHPYIDKNRIGAMGASYGGFLTQYLATQSGDLFAAYISHAGISSISSYWGVGDWGYSYSAVATANSYPWNRKDIYVGHSPLYMADRIKKPLLLLHGDIDNNVPPGESFQMFTALKILKKDVALVMYKGQQHWILDYKKRYHWMNTIIAWFDKYLKGDSEKWDYLFKK